MWFRFTATLRAREVGIRVALGATPRQVVAEILRGAMVPLACGLMVSLMAALLLSRLLTSLLYEISGTDPVAYGLAVVVLLGTGCWRASGQHGGLRRGIRCRRSGWIESWSSEYSNWPFITRFAIFNALPAGLRRTRVDEWDRCA